MAITAIDPQAEHKFIPESEKDADEPTFFIVRGLTSREKLNLSACAGSQRNERISPEIVEYVLKTCLLGWDNFNDSKGEQVPFINDMMANLDRIPQEILIEITVKVLSLSGVTVELQKN